MMEYTGKMLNKAKEEEAPEFYQDVYIIAQHAALFVAGINKINVRSDNTMYRQILREAKINPQNSRMTLRLRLDSRHPSYLETRRPFFDRQRGSVRWARKFMLLNYPILDLQHDSGFRKIVEQIKY